MWLRCSSDGDRKNKCDFPDHRTFSGRPKGRDFQKEAGNLYDSLKKNSVDVSNIDMNIFYAVTYDSPFRLFFRRNEVWLLPKKKEGEETKQAAQGNGMEQQAEWMKPYTFQEQSLKNDQLYFALCSIFIHSLTIIEIFSLLDFILCFHNHEFS